MRGYKLLLSGLSALGVLIGSEAQAYDLNNGRLLASNCTQCHSTNVLPKSGGYDSLVGESYNEIYGELREFQSTVSQFIDVLKQNVKNYPVSDYGRARSFLDSLAHEVRMSGN